MRELTRIEELLAGKAIPFKRLDVGNDEATVEVGGHARRAQCERDDLPVVFVADPGDRGRFRGARSVRARIRRSSCEAASAKPDVVEGLARSAPSEDEEVPRDPGLSVEADRGLDAGHLREVDGARDKRSM